jgi:hypothetical protein
MNQRVGPSLVYSFLIVCFFAVALFQPDGARSAGGRSRLGPNEAAARLRQGSRSGRDRGASKRSEQTARDGNSSTPRTIASAQPRGSSAQAGAGVALLPSPTGSAALNAHGDRSAGEPASGSPNAPVQRASARSDRGQSGTTRARAAASEVERSVGAREPRSAFTVAEHDETIDDVAVRVYGTSDKADALWRANRDTLPRKDSPLSPGMLLRTPRGR